MKLEKSTTILQNEFLDLIAHAESLRQYIEKHNDNELITKIKESFLDSDRISLSRAREIAREIGLEDYLDRVIDTFYIDPATQEQDVLNNGAIPTPEGLKNIYYTKLSKHLENYLPHGKIEFCPLYSHKYALYLWEPIIDQSDSIKRTRKKKIRYNRIFMAEFDIIKKGNGQRTVYVTTYKPKFMHLFAGEVKDISRKFGYTPKIEFTYGFK